jgi:hypothetical protein
MQEEQPESVEKLPIAFFNRDSPAEQAAPHCFTFGAAQPR